MLVFVARQPTASLHEIARSVGVDERHVQRALNDLEFSGCLTRRRVGRGNTYAVNREARLRHSLAGQRTVGELLDFIDDRPERS